MACQAPSADTLKKYGLTEPEWLAILERQGGVCAVCKKEPSPPKAHPERGGRLCTDHDHVKGFKKMPPELRKLYVRGLLCFFCNHYYAGRGITVFKSKNVTAYLERYEQQKLDAGLNPQQPK